MMTSDTRKPDLSYQRHDVRKIFEYVKAGDSCAIVGIGSVGKSNMMRHLLWDEVKQDPVNLGKAEGRETVMVFLNPHKMLFLEEDAQREVGRCWPGYEILLNRLRRALLEQDLNPDPVPGDEALGDVVNAKYVSLFGQAEYAQTGLIKQAGIRHLEDALLTIFERHEDWKVVFLFDEIEEFFERLPAEFFQALRGMRDDHKQQVLFITASRRPLTEIVQEMAPDRGKKRYIKAMEGFIELFHEATIYISPLDETSAKQAVGRYLQRYRKTPTEAQESVLKGAMYHATGGHAGLLRRSFSSFWYELTREPATPNSRQLRTPEILRKIVWDPAVMEECRIIFESLPRKERDALRTLSRGDSGVGLLELHSLQRKRLVNAQNRIAFPLLEQYVLVAPPDSVPT